MTSLTSSLVFSSQSLMLSLKLLQSSPMLLKRLFRLVFKKKNSVLTHLQFRTVVVNSD